MASAAATEASTSAASEAPAAATTATTSVWPAAPDRYIGLWRRSVEEDPVGTVADTTTLVQWIQSHSTYVDMRVPKELVQTPQGDPSQATTAAGAADSAQPAVSAAAAQKSFAGRSTITTDDVCTWHRHIDFHPPTGGKDIGRNTFSKDGKELVEVGFDGSYLERWDRVVDGSSGGILAMELVCECKCASSGSGSSGDGDGAKPCDCSTDDSACKGALARSGYWVVVEDRFGCAVGRQVAGADAADSAYVTATVAPSFNKLLADSGWEEGRQRAVIAAYEACFGTVDSALAFTVLNSLDGRQAGKQLAAPTDTAAQWQLSVAPAAADSAAATSKQQQQHVLQFNAASGVTRRWAVVENTHQLFSDKGSALQLAPLVYKA